MKPVLIIGAGGHAKVLADALLASGRQVLGFVESSAKDGHQAEVLPGLLVLGTDARRQDVHASADEETVDWFFLDCRNDAVVLTYYAKRNLHFVPAYAHRGIRCNCNVIVDH